MQYITPTAVFSGQGLNADLLTVAIARNFLASDTIIPWPAENKSDQSFSRWINVYS